MPPAGFDARHRAEAADFVVHFRADPASIEVGRLFAIEAVVCERQPGSVATELAIDANMPDHRHGMNYRPTIAPLGDRRFRADGLMFHMPGRWQLVFDVGTGARRERLTAELVVE